MLYSVVFTIDGPRNELPTIRRSLRKALGVTREESEYRYLADGDAESYWFRAEALGGSGILTRAQFAALLEDIGNPWPDDCETMGTLGGPLGGIVPDVNFISDAPETILSMRVTPVARRGNIVADSERAEAVWKRLRRAVRSVYESGCDPKRKTFGAEYARTVRAEIKAHAGIFS